jgi:hypothetical protein
VSDRIRVADEPERGVRVGGCEGDGSFVAVVDRRSGREEWTAFVFDAAGHLIRAVGPTATPLAAPAEPALARLLATLEPYQFDDQVDVRPFHCTVGGRTAALAADEHGTGYELRALGLRFPAPYRGAPP